MNEPVYHTPALFDECMKGLDIKPDGRMPPMVAAATRAALRVISAKRGTSMASTRTSMLTPTASTALGLLLYTATLPT